MSMTRMGEVARHALVGDDWVRVAVKRLLLLLASVLVTSYTTVDYASQ